MIVTFPGKLYLCQRLLVLGNFVYVSDCNISWKTLNQRLLLLGNFMSAIVTFLGKLCLCQRLLLLGNFMSAIVTFLGKLVYVSDYCFLETLCQRLLLPGNFVYVSDCNISWKTLFMSATIASG